MSLSVGPVRRSGSIARRNARRREVMTTSSVSPPILLSLPGDTAAMAICYARGLTIDDKQVERIWQREGLKVPHKQPKRGWLWLADRSCIRLRPEQRPTNFVEDAPTMVASIGCSSARRVHP